MKLNISKLLIDVFKPYKIFLAIEENLENFRKEKEKCLKIA